MDVVDNIVMTATTPSTVKDHELVSFGLVESAGVNSFSDFMPSKYSDSQEKFKNENDFKNILICHLIFYVLFCVSLFLHILLDLGLGSFIKNSFFRMIGFREKTFFDKRPVFA